MSSSVTFGLELEFICVHEKDAFSDLNQYLASVSGSDPYDSDFDLDSDEAIRHKLSEAGIPARTTQQREDPATGPFSFWFVFHDEHKLIETEKECVPGYRRMSIELISPVFDFGDEQSFQQIQRVLEVLSSMEAELDCKFVCNTSCGLHVHMGIGKDTMVPLPIAKRIFQLTTAHEHNLDALHAASRIIVPDVNWLGTPYIPLSFYHRDGELEEANDGDLEEGSDEEMDEASDEEMEEGSDGELGEDSHSESEGGCPNIFDWLQRIETVRSNADLAGLLRCQDNKVGPHWASTNFENLHKSEKDEAKPKTIEFRQHVGTLDFAEISRYVRFLGSLFTYCSQADDGSFLELLVKATDVNFTLEDLRETFSGSIQADASMAGQYAQPSQNSSVTEREVGDSELRPLEALQHLNSREVAANHDPLAIQACRDCKWDVGLYGIRNDIASDAIVEFIEEASRPVLASSHTGLGRMSSQARASTLGTIASVYRKL